MHSSVALHYRQEPARSDVYDQYSHATLWYRCCYRYPVCSCYIPQSSAVGGFSAWTRLIIISTFSPPPPRPPTVLRTKLLVRFDRSIAHLVVRFARRCLVQLPSITLPMLMKRLRRHSGHANHRSSVSSVVATSHFTSHDDAARHDPSLKSENSPLTSCV